MNGESEPGFRITLLILLLAFVAHRVYYHRKLRPSSEQQTRNGKPGSVPASLLGVAALVATVVYLAYPKLMSWSSVPMPAWLRWSGVAVAVSGFVLLQWAHHALGRNWSDAPRLQTEHTLVTSGPYRWIRHPIYTAFLLILSTPLLISANWFIGLVWIAMTVLDVIRRIRIEEALLISRFGDRYRSYMQATGRLLPRLPSTRSAASER